MKIAVFLPNWIGDAVMATPALRAIRTKFSDAEVVGVMRPYVADVLSGLDLVDRYLFHDPRGQESDRRGWRFAMKLRREKPDLAVLFPNSLRSGWMAWLSGAKRRVGFDRDGRGWLLTDAVIPRPKSRPNPVLDEYLRLVDTLGCSEHTHQTELAVSTDDLNELNVFWQQQDPSLLEKGLVCVNPGGAFGAAKHWPSESFGLLARRIAHELDKTVLVVCGPSERMEAIEICRAADHPRVVSLAEQKLSLGMTKAAISTSEMLVTTDSGPRHFAPPFDVPVVTLFGPTHKEWSETYYSQSIHLQLDVDCGPCQQRVCPLEHHRCMRDLTPEMAFSAVTQYLKKAS